MSWVETSTVSEILQTNHYLGPIRRGFAWKDEFGVIVLGHPTSRRVPQQWLELTRWCIVSNQKNAGSKQWAAMIKALKKKMPDITTIVSYSDPSVGHTGALYRACNWLWAPTWHRLRPPPTGQGSWTEGKQQSVKDRWVFLVKEDALREDVLVAKDASILKRMPFARYIEPQGANYKAWREMCAGAAE